MLKQIANCLKNQLLMQSLSLKYKFNDANPNLRPSRYCD